MNIMKYFTGLGLMIPLAILIPLIICSLLSGMGRGWSRCFFPDNGDAQVLNDGNGQSTRTGLVEDVDIPKTSFLGTFFGIDNKNARSEYFQQR